MEFQQISLKDKRQTTSNTDLKQLTLYHESCITKKRSSLFGLDHLESKSDLLFRSLSRKSFLNRKDYKIKECETMNWKTMGNDSKSILNELNKTDSEYEMDLENNNYEFKLNNYELCYDSSDFLEVNIFCSRFAFHSWRYSLHPCSRESAYSLLSNSCQEIQINLFFPSIATRDFSVNTENILLK
jgi:hypothetical protein